MGTIIIQTQDNKDLKIETSLKNEDIQNLLKKIKEKEKINKAFDRLKGILNTDKSAGELIREIYDEIYGGQ